MPEALYWVLMKETEDAINLEHIIPWGSNSYPWSPAKKFHRYESFSLLFYMAKSIPEQAYATEYPFIYGYLSHEYIWVYTFFTQVIFTIYPMYDSYFLIQYQYRL